MVITQTYRLHSLIVTDTVTLNNHGPFYYSIIEMVQTNYKNTQYKNVQLGHIMLYACICTSTQSVHTNYPKARLSIVLHLSVSIYQGECVARTKSGWGLPSMLLRNACKAGSKTGLCSRDSGLM